MKKIAIIPALNCERTIGRVVVGLHGLVDETIVVNDGSTDQTGHRSYTNGATVVTHRENGGLGKALQTGFREALQRGADIIVTLDGDGQHDPKDINRVLAKLETDHCDAVIGSRLLDRRGWKKFPRHLLLGNLVLTRLTNMACGEKVTTDSQSGYRAFKRQVVEEMHLTSSRMATSSEIILEISKNGFQIKEVPIEPTYANESSHQDLIVDPFRILLMLATRRLTRHQWKKTRHHS